MKSLITSTAAYTSAPPTTCTITAPGVTASRHGHSTAPITAAASATRITSPSGIGSRTCRRPTHTVSAIATT
jgi:hypothetical protein